MMINTNRGDRRDYDVDGNYDYYDDAVSDEVIKETLKSKLSNMQLSKTAVEFLTNQDVAVMVMVIVLGLGYCHGKYAIDQDRFRLSFIPTEEMKREEQ